MKKLNLNMPIINTFFNRKKSIDKKLIVKKFYIGTFRTSILPLKNF